MNNVSDGERPGTSFTSKRQIQTQQSRRPQMNIGTLETEDPIQRPGTNQTNYTPSEEKLRKFLFRQNKGAFSQKNIPKQMLQDKERLYEETQQCKIIVNQLKIENSKLKTKNQNLEEEIMKLSRLGKQANPANKIIDAYYKEDKPPEPKQATILFELKKKNHDFKAEILKKEAIIQQMKKDPKFQQCNELKMQVQAYQDETKRLRNMLEQAIAIQLREQYFKFSLNLRYDQNAANVLNTFRQDNLEMAALIKNQENDIQLLEVKFREANARANKLQYDCLSQKRLIQQLEKEIISLKNRDTQTIGQKKQANQIEQELKSELDHKMTECNQLNNSLMMKEKKITDLEKKIKQMQSEQEQKIAAIEREKALLQEKIVAMREELQAAQFLSLTNIQGGKRRSTVVSPGLHPQFDGKTLISIDEVEDHNDDQLFHEIKRMPIILKEEVADTGRKLRYQLKNQHIELKDLAQYLFEDNTEIISISQLQQNLKLYPFDLDEQTSLIVARYLVEDNNEPFVLYSPEVTSPIPYVRSILKTLLGNYEILNQAQELTMRTEISQLITKHKYSARDHILRLKSLQRTHLKENICLVDHLLESIADANFNQKQTDYILAANFHLTGQLNEIDYDNLFKYFNYEEVKTLNSLPQTNRQFDSQKLIKIEKDQTDPPVDYSFEQQKEEEGKTDKSQTLRNPSQEVQLENHEEQKEEPGNKYNHQQFDKPDKELETEQFSQQKEQNYEIVIQQYNPPDNQLEDKLSDDEKQHIKEQVKIDKSEQHEQLENDLDYKDEFELNKDQMEANAKDHLDYDD